MGDSAYTHMLIMTSAACDARMDGAMIPVMSNSGSGNQGIAATLPVLSFAEDIQCSEEQLIRALMLSHLTAVCWATTASSAMLSALMAMEDKVVTSVEGIIDEDVDKSIANLTAIGSKGMEATDRLVLDIMTGKSC